MGYAESRRAGLMMFGLTYTQHMHYTFGVDRLAWKRAGDCILMWLVGVAIVSLSEALYQARSTCLVGL